MTTIKDIALQAAAAARGNRPAPRCDAFDPEKLPYGVAAGGNKFGLTECPTCGKPPTPANQPPLAFLFRNQISATEYTISGMCQACQDGVFGPDPEDEE